MDDLCGQVEQLMAMKDKHVADLTALEEKYKKASVEVRFRHSLGRAKSSLLICGVLQKSKADAKYFATMKAKDMLEGLKTTLESTLDKQSKRIQKLQESEQALKQQIVSLILREPRSSGC